MINLPVALLLYAVTLRAVPESRDEHAPGKVDLVGAALATAALGLLTYGFIALQGAPPGRRSCR